MQEERPARVIDDEQDEQEEDNESLEDFGEDLGNEEIPAQNENEQQRVTFFDH